VLQNPAQTYSAHIDTLVVSLEATDATKKYRISLQEEPGDDAASKRDPDRRLLALEPKAAVPR
jgi:hypothetical protein